MIRLLLIILFSILSYLFLITNKNVSVDIRYFWGMGFRSIPLYILISGSFLAGMLISVTILLPEWIKLKIDSRRQKKVVASMEEELSKLRKLTTREEKGYISKNDRSDSFDEAI